MSVDWLTGLVCGLVAAWFFLGGASAGARVTHGHTPFDPTQRRPDPPPAPPKPTPPRMRTYRDGDSAPLDEPIVDEVVAYCANRGRGVYLVTPLTGAALPPDNGRC